MLIVIAFLAGLAIPDPVGAVQGPAPSNPAVANPAVATPAVAAPVTAPVAPKLADGEQVVCKSTPVTGTRFSSRVCRTKDQWAEMTRDARDYVDHNTRLSCGPSGCH